MNNKKLSSLPLGNININDSYFTRYIDLVSDVIIPHQWSILNDLETNMEPSHCIANLKIAAGEEQGSFSGMVFQDTDAAKWLEAVAYSLQTKPDPILEKKADELINLIAKAQQPDGYLNTYFTLTAPGERFQNLEECHELYTAGHFIEAAVAYDQATGKRKFLDVMCRFADLICATFGMEKGQIHGYPGHQEIELALIRLYHATEEKRYLDTAKYFIEQRGQTPNYFDEESKHKKEYIFPDFKDFDREYSQSHVPVRQQDKAVGHAVRALYMYIAVADLAYEYDDSQLMDVCETLWENVVNRQMYITGSVGSSAFGERFTVDYDLPNDTNYSETCATVALAQWGLRLAQIKRDAKYMDIVERALYNTLVAGVSLSGKEFFYVNPLEVQPRTCHPSSSKRHVKPVRQKWFACACCPPNVARTLASMGNFIYMVDDDSIFINLFLTNKTAVNVNDGKVELEMCSDFPNSGHITVCVETTSSVAFSLAVRIPDYAENFSVKLDHEPVSPIVQKGYAIFDRMWNQKTVMEIDFKMAAKIIHCNPRVRANIQKGAIVKGPVVYCLEQTDNFENLAAIVLEEDVELTESYDQSLMGGVTVIQAKAKQISFPEGGGELYSGKRPQYKSVDIKAVPYGLWGNREAGEMIVWIHSPI